MNKIIKTLKWVIRRASVNITSLNIRIVVRKCKIIME